MPLEPKKLKLAASNLEAKYNGKLTVGTGYGLININDGPETAQWILFVYADDPADLNLPREYEGYYVQVMDPEVR